MHRCSWKEFRGCSVLLQHWDLLIEDRFDPPEVDVYKQGGGPVYCHGGINVYIPENY